MQAFILLHEILIYHLNTIYFPSEAAYYHYKSRRCQPHIRSRYELGTIIIAGKLLLSLKESERGRRGAKPEEELSLECCMQTVAAVGAF